MITEISFVYKQNDKLRFCLELEIIMSKLRDRKKGIGALFFALVVSASSAALVYAETVTTFQSQRFYYDTTAHYTSSFKPNVTENISPYIDYENVFSNGYYYVGSRYEADSYNYVYSEANKYYASYIADGRLVSALVTANKSNQIYIKGTSDLFMDINYMRFTFK